MEGEKHNNHTVASQTKPNDPHQRNDKDSASKANSATSITQYGTAAASNEEKIRALEVIGT
jgi:hypothetical protein